MRKSGVAIVPITFSLAFSDPNPSSTHISAHWRCESPTLRSCMALPARMDTLLGVYDSSPLKSAYRCSS